MKWPQWRKSMPARDPKIVEESADRAVEAANRALREARDRWPEVREVSGRLHKASRKTDRFAALFPELGGGKGK